MVMQILVENSASAAFVCATRASRRDDLRGLHNMISLIRSTLSGVGYENGRPCGLLSTDPS